MKLTFKNLTCYLLFIGGFLFLAESCNKSDNDPEGETSIGTVKDIDGNVYHPDTIGEQVWMIENLKTTKYRDGSPIPKVTNNTDWGSLTKGSYCNFNNDAANGNKYGRLYNWYAVNDIRNIAPEGWHVATNDEWTKLETYVAENPGTSGSLAKSLAAITDWNYSERTDAIGNDLTKNNSSGFTALPGGNRTSDGAFGFDGYYGGWWSSTESSNFNAFIRILSYDNILMGKGSYGKNRGYSVRCVKD